MLHHRAETGPISVAPGSAGAFLSHSAHFAQCELITPASAERAIRPNLGTQGTHTNRQGSARPIPPVSGPDRRVPTGLFRSSLKKGPTLVELQSQQPSRTDELLTPEIITGNHRAALKFRGKVHLYEFYGNYQYGARTRNRNN